MRGIVSAGGMLVVMVLVCLIHFGLVNNSVRENEIHSGLSMAMDYSIDMLSQEAFKDEEDFLQNCCMVLSSAVTSDGVIDVYLLDSDWEAGFIDIVVEETYQYGFMERHGKTRCERAFRIVG